MSRLELSRAGEAVSHEHETDDNGHAGNLKAHQR